MNNMRDIIRKKAEGIEFDKTEDKKEKKDYAKKYADSELIELWHDCLKQGKITKEYHDRLVDCWNMVKKHKTAEANYKNQMEKYIDCEPLYNDFLSKIRGIGPIISANMIAKFGDCNRFDTVSKLWAYTGNQVDNEGKALKRKKGVKLMFNSKLRSLTWKISDSLMKTNKGYYRAIYNEEKNKQLTRTYPQGELFKKYGEPYKQEDIQLKLGHAHNRALRKIRKIFLSHLWTAARELAGLPIERTYVEGVLEHTHIVSWREAIEREDSLKVIEE